MPDTLVTRDITGAEVSLRLPLRTIVSLVPSITETIFSLGAGERLVGRTRYCIEPKDRVQGIERVGGTKDPAIGRILELKPDIVLANREENRREDIETLRAGGLQVYVTEPQSPAEAMADVEIYGRMLEKTAEAAVFVSRTHRLLNELKSQRQVRAPRVVCLIWREPWMAVGRDTYIGGMIRALGGVNVFENATERYFEISADGLREANPDILLLPSEPYHFRERHVAELREMLVGLLCAHGGIRLCNGEDLSWFGARTPDALERLRDVASRAPA
ncbi:MAG: helical backbone metal receptor [Planctomycetes bacterium]|nr:helical backbone metal receptor [Planctomycetota bacterium]NUQ35670.1 ABC transporter substrate-binding protein [Planctomycetaceae bacterium]